jgi:hypothetical protein
LFFFNAGEDLIMADDVTMPSNLLVASIEEKLEEAPLNMNVSQQLCKEESFIKVVCI